MKLSLSTILDTAFCALVTFILSFVLFCYFLPRDFSLLYSVCIALLLSLIAFKFFSQKSAKTTLKSKMQKECAVIINRLNFSTIDKNCALFCRALEKNGYAVERKSGGIFLRDKKCALFIRFGLDEITKSDILRVFNALPKGYAGYILSEKFSAPIVEFSSLFKGAICLVDGQKAYEYLKQTDTLPAEKFAFLEKQTPRANLKNLLYKKRAKTFFLFGFTTLFFSYFAPLKIYYLIFGSCFLIFALVLRLFGKN